METIETPIARQHTPISVLKNYFGYDAFRGPQKEIINSLIAGKDLLVLMPTGGGKSLCYQIPALIRPGVGIVISPLISLMEDQVSALKLQGVQAAYYNSSLTRKEELDVISKLKINYYNLLYISPERLVTSSFLEFLHICKPSLFAIDEAHCISQWGHDFRPEYTSLSLLKKHFPDVPIIALTATADEQTRQDIVKQLNYIPQQFVASFNRPNIHYRVIIRDNPIKQLKDFLKTQVDKPGIIYCSTRKTVEQLTQTLHIEGFSVKPYHAGLSHNARSSAQSLFRHDNIDIIVATIAFGMGIDKPNVRFVVHYNLPKSIESYYQETGRAGRDGMPALALLLYAPADSAQLCRFIAMIENKEQQRIETSKLNYMLAFARATHCRRQILLRYFDELNESACNNCDICDNPPLTQDVTIDAQKFLSCIYRLSQNYGMIYIIEILRGTGISKIKKPEHQYLSTFGIGKDKSVQYWKQLAWQLIHQNYCYQDLANFGVLRLSNKASSILTGSAKVSISILNSPPHKEAKTHKEVKTKILKSSKVIKNDKALDISQEPLFEILRLLRRKLADEENKPSFMIFSDTTLHAIARDKPQTLEQFLDISGVGQYKLEHYGEYFIKAVHEYLDFGQACMQKDAYKLVQEN